MPTGDDEVFYVYYNREPRPVSPLRPSDEFERVSPPPTDPVLRTLSPDQSRQAAQPDPPSPAYQSKSATIEYASAIEPESPNEARRPMWTPIWLYKSVLIIFAVAFAIMMLATALLYHFSQENDGLSAQRPANHYGWKYGPTACKSLLRSHSLKHSIDFLQYWSWWEPCGDKLTTSARH